MTSTTHGATTFTLTSDTEITMTREFAAPAALVFEASTRPEHVRRWWGPRDHEMITCDIDLRPGGSWRWVLRDREGNEVGFHGVCQETDPPSRIVHTECFDPVPDDESLVTVTFEERDSRTLMTSASRYSSKEVRDIVIQSGMEAGAAESLDRLAEIVVELGQTVAG